MKSFIIQALDAMTLKSCSASYRLKLAPWRPKMTAAVTLDKPVFVLSVNRSTHVIQLGLILLSFGKKKKRVTKTDEYKIVLPSSNND